ncbi:hypothetical protein M0805_001342 [Coniferiporia weirii]|nr:hypothetical protein M0805_001342 [Coniferiporia weirii]
MSTFPRHVRVDVDHYTATSALRPPRPASDAPPTTSLIFDTGLGFDAGINSSSAWTEYLGRGRAPGADGLPNADASSIPDEETGRDVDHRLHHSSEELWPEGGQPARVLFDFMGMREHGELCVRADMTLEILQESVAFNLESEDLSSSKDVAEGWSLARVSLEDVVGAEEGVDESELSRGEIGLVPRAYYAFITECISQEPSETVDSGNTTTPRASGFPTTAAESSYLPPASPNQITQRSPLTPQTTGEWFRAQLRRSFLGGSLLGGRSFNRFSRFVTSGAEEFVLHGSSAQSTNTPENKNDSSGLPPAPDWRLSAYMYPEHAHMRELSSSSAVSDSGTKDIETDPDTHVVDVGPAWRAKVPPFSVSVHSPETRRPSGAEAFVVYNVTSMFPDLTTGSDAADSEDETEPDSEDTPLHSPQTYSITVQRRFSHFVQLHNALSARLPGLALPPLPEKAYAGRFNADFVEARRTELERYMTRLVAHPVVRYAAVLTFFLGCESDVEWHREFPQYIRRRPVGASFFARVFHPAFHFDAEDAEDAGVHFAEHTRAVGEGVQQLRGNFAKVRSARVEMASAERLLSHSILSLITSTPLASRSSPDSPSDDDSGSDENGEGTSHLQSTNRPGSNTSARTRKGRRRKKGLMNEEGAWCWREDCAGMFCLKTAETLQGVADLYDDHARRTMLATEDSLKDVAHPSTIYAPVLDIHNATLSRYKEASTPANPSDDTQKGDLPEDDVATRCETVLNTTMAEFEVYHAQKQDDFARITKAHLDAEIAFHEKVLARLRTTRTLFDASPTELALTMPGARVPSVFERDLVEPAPRPRPLPRPCPHVLDRASMRPVGSMLQGSVGLLLGLNGDGIGVGGVSRKDGDGDGAGEADGRGSTFGRFW